MPGSTRVRNPIFGRGAAVALVAALVVGCSGGGGDEARTSKRSIGASVDIAAGPVTVASAGPPGAVLPDPVRDQIVERIREYVDVATIAPLRTGKPAGDIGPLFTANAAGRVAGPDRAIVVDEELPRRDGEGRRGAQPVALTALADQAGAVILVSANLYLAVATESRDGPVTIAPAGELLFAPEADTWKVSGFDLSVNRAGAGLDTRAKNRKAPKEDRS